MRTPDAGATSPPRSSPTGAPAASARGRRFPALLLIALAVAGCASGGGAETTGQGTTTGAAAGAGTAVTITVENRTTPETAFSVQLVSSTGDRDILGQVGPGQTETFQVDVQSGRSYRLVAGLPGGRDISSERFTAPEGTRVRWVVPFNTLNTSP